MAMHDGDKCWVFFTDSDKNVGYWEAQLSECRIKCMKKIPADADDVEPIYSVFIH